MRMFLTGASGFIGRAVLEALLRAGHEVSALVRRPADRATPVPAGPRWIAGDLAAPDGLDGARAALAEAEVVLHLAAVRRDWGLSDDDLRRVNVESGPRLLERASAARRFVHMSSVAVYGHPSGGPAREDAPRRPSKRYGRSKLEAEQAIVAAAARRAMPLTILRPGVVYGPGDTYGMVANLARLVARGRFLRVGSGRSRLNLLYLDDLAAVVARAAVEPAAAGQDFLLAGPEAIPVGRLIDTVARAVGRPVPRLAVPEPAARLGAWVLERAYRLAGLDREPFLTRAKVDLFTREDLWDTSKARERLGFSPAVDLEAGVPRLVGWLRQAGELG